MGEKETDDNSSNKEAAFIIICSSLSDIDPCLLAQWKSCCLVCVIHSRSFCLSFFCVCLCVFFFFFSLHQSPLPTTRCLRRLPHFCILPFFTSHTQPYIMRVAEVKSSKEQRIATHSHIKACPPKSLFFLFH